MTEFKLTTTEKKCCHFCAFGISPERKKQLTEKLEYIAGQVIVNSDADAATVLKHIALECETPEELVCMAWVIGSWAAAMQVLIEVKKTGPVMNALKVAATIPTGEGGKA